MEYEEFSGILIQGLKDLNLPLLDHDILQKIFLFHQFFNKWNKVINLSAHRNESESLEKNILDSLVLNYYVKDESSILDFGSGGGFPGLILKICNPNHKYRLVEADQKKAAFLNNALVHLQIKELEIIKERITSINVSNIVSTYECIVSRATMAFEELATLFKDGLKSNNKIIAMVSPHFNEENLNNSLAYKINFIHSYHLPISHSPRKIISVVKL